MAGPKHLDPADVRSAFEVLDAVLPSDATLIVGGGTAMVLAYGIPVRTTDVDAYPTGMTFDELDPFIKQVARERGLSGDWINPHYSTFAHVLPADYGSRLREVFAGRRLRVQALGAEDLLVMKCFAGREKDVGHARRLLRHVKELSIVEARLEELAARRIPGAREAIDFLDELLELEG